MRQVLHESIRPGVEVAITLLTEDGGGALSGTVGAFSGDGVCIALPRRLPAGTPVHIEAGRITLLAEAIGFSREKDAHLTYFAVQHWFPTPEAPVVNGYVPSSQREEAYMPDDAAASLRRSLSNIETVFGRLMHVALAAQLSTDLSPGNAKLRSAVNAVHNEVFADWLSLTLQQQRNDIEAYISSLHGHRRQLLKCWTGIANDLDLVPYGVAPHERQLYAAEFRAHVELIFNSMSAETGGTVPVLKPAPATNR